MVEIKTTQRRTSNKEFYRFKTTGPLCWQGTANQEFRLLNDGAKRSHHSTFGVRCSKNHMLIYCLSGPVRTSSRRSGIARDLINCNQFQPPGLLYRPATVADAKFLVDIFQMAFNGFRGNEQLVRDLLVLQAL